MKIKNLFRLFNSSVSHKEDHHGDSKGQELKLSDDMELHVRGMPENLTHKHRTKVLSSLVRNALANAPDRAYLKGENIHRSTASIRINEKIYEIEFSLHAKRVLTALTIYKQAFDEINEGAETGRYDSELADMTADFIKQSAWHEVQKFKKQQSNTEQISSVKEEKSNDIKSISSLQEGTHNE